MDTEVKKFIEDNISLLEKDDFEQFYKKLGTERTSSGRFTEVFLGAGIDPAEYMREIPSYYLTGAKITSYTIPQNITSMAGYAFFDCNNPLISYPPSYILCPKPLSNSADWQDHIPTFP